MNLREALEVLQEARKGGLSSDTAEYFIDSDLDCVLLSFDEVDQLEEMGVYCWYVQGAPPLGDDGDPIMHYYSIGGSK